MSLNQRAAIALTVFAVSGTASAASFAPIPPLSFVKPYAGADPLPQTLTLASTGAAFNLVVKSVTTNSGGSWLTVTGCAGYCPAPHAVTVTVTTGAALAPGTYTGQIVFNEYSNTFSMTVPVTLTVAPAGGTYFDNFPGQMSFSFKTSANNPPSQTIDVRNAGAGTLTWSLSASTSDGGNWLSASTGSGTAPQTVSISINKGALPGAGVTPGSFIGQLVFQNGGGNVTVPVSVVVGANVFAQVNAIGFAKPYAGADPLPQTLTVPSTGAAFNLVAAAYTATGGNWLSVEGCAGYCSTPHEITAKITTSAAMPAGTYTGQIVFTEYYGSMAITVPVTLIVAAPSTAFFDNLPGQMSFSMKTGGIAPPAQPLEIRDGGTGTLNWTLSSKTADGGNWLSFSAASGTAPSIVNISVAPQNLPGSGLVAGTFLGGLVLTGAGGSVTVPVSINVGDNVFRQVNAINFTKPYAGANPLPQIITVASTGAAFNLVAAAFTATGGNWLTVTGCAGYCNTPQAITATVNAGPSLAAGTYTGQIVLTEYYGSMSITIPVTLTIAAANAPYFDNVPGQMSFSMVTAGKAPPVQTVELRNAGSGTLVWTLATSTSDGGSWLGASSFTGTAPSLVDITVNPQNLPGNGLVAGTYLGELVFRTGGDSVTVSVSFNVGANVFQQANAIGFTKPYGGANPLPQTLTIASTGTAFNLTATASTATGGNWLTISGCSGYCAAPHAITAAINADPALAAGTYTGQIVFTEYYGSMSIAVPVTLTVGAPSAPLFDNVQGGLTFSFKPTSANPASQTVQIRNVGGGALNWTLAATTSDGGNWLTVSANSGSAPSTVTVSVVNSALPDNGLVAGTFTGELKFRAAGQNITVPVNVIVGASVFTPPGALNFSEPFGGPNPLSQTLTPASTGSAFNVVTVASSGNGGKWLTVTGCAGYCPTPTALTVVASGASLPAGIYTGQIVFTEYYGSMPETVPVYLSVGQGTLQTVTVNSVPSGLAFSAAGAGCAAGAYSTPQTLQWTPGSSCSLTFSTPQGGYTFNHWEDNSTAASRGITAPSAAATYTATFTQPVGTVPVTVNSVPSGLVFSAAGTGCAPGVSYTTPNILQWTSGSSCALTFTTPQGNYNFNHWEDSSTAASRSIIAPSTASIYTATFQSGSPVNLPWRAGVFRNGTWVLDNGNFNWDNPAIDLVTSFGQPGDTPILGDWDGSGKTKIGVFRNGEWFLDSNGNGVYDPGVDLHGFFGGPGDIPVVGDWDGNGKTKVGVFRKGVWVLDMNGNIQFDQGIDRIGSFGAPTDVPVVGDWTGDKKSKVGVYRLGVWLLDTNGNTQWDPGVDLVGSFGAPTDVILLGDWTGDGRTKVGVYRNGAWVLDMNGNANWDGPQVDLVGSFGGGPTDRPVIGDWDGTGKIKIGIYRSGVWILDLGGTALYNPSTVQIGSFGIPTDVPLTGKWAKP